VKPGRKRAREGEREEKKRSEKLSLRSRNEKKERKFFRKGKTFQPEMRCSLRIEKFPEFVATSRQCGLPLFLSQSHQICRLYEYIKSNLKESSMIMTANNSSPPDSLRWHGRCL
jgi:hypothetical protein